MAGLFAVYLCYACIDVSHFNVRAYIIESVHYCGGKGECANYYLGKLPVALVLGLARPPFLITDTTPRPTRQHRNDCQSTKHVTHRDRLAKKFCCSRYRCRSAFCYGRKSPQDGMFQELEPYSRIAYY